MQKIVLVTGGGSGIGLAIAEKFISQNHCTIIIGRNEQKLADAKEKLGPLCETIACDLRLLSAIPSLVSGIVERFGRIDVLINNAGINMKKEFTEVTDEEFQRILLTNVNSVF